MSWLSKPAAKNAATEYDIAAIKSDVVDKISAAIMAVDRDLVVTYVNTPTRELLNKHAAAFRTFWPGFDPDKIMGTCIDMFHKNPAHQRKLLSDPTRLPYKTEITIGDLKIALSVNGSFNARGEHVGNVLEWMDVTNIRLNEGMLAAINRAQAVVEMAIDGRIQNANENFLKITGYSLADIRGQHHSVLVDPVMRQSDDYKRFWEKLARGEFEVGQFQRVGKSGQPIWIQASYNPIVDANGKAFKVVEYATDITADKEIEGGISVVAQAAVGGDFSQRIEVEGKTGSLASVAGSMNALADRISRTIYEVKSAAREVTNASAEIATSTTDLSQRTEEQAASLEQTSSSMEQIASTMKKNAENATNANEQARGTCDVASRGGEVVAKAVEAMARIEESSRKISDIIGVIDEIARQTNLLALNAAVEAARAGEAGRGFAVVASEVRNLAQRSSQAAKDIKDLINNSTGQVKEGVDLVNRAGTSLHEIVGSIRHVADTIAEIASASAEQATGIEQINRALTQMDEVTQQNSALVEQNAATAKTLEHQAQSMDQLVAAFVIDESRIEGADASGPAESGKPRAVSPARGAPKAVVPKPGAGKPAARAAANPVGRMQAALATAVKLEPDWKEF